MLIKEIASPSVLVGIIVALVGVIMLIYVTLCLLKTLKSYREVAKWTTNR